MNNPLITIFIPCLNEEGNILGTLRSVISASEKINFSIEIIVVDDGSNDDTYKKALGFSKKYKYKNISNIKVIKNKNNKGIGYNFRKVAKNAKGDYFRMVMGDNVENKKIHLKIFKSLEAADVLIPVYTKIYNKPKFRIILSNLFSILINFASGNNVGYYNGSAVMKTKEINKTNIVTDGFCFQAELLVKVLGRNLRYKELYFEASHNPESSALKWKNFRDAIKLFIIIIYYRFKVTH